VGKPESRTHRFSARGSAEKPESKAQIAVVQKKMGPAVLFRITGSAFSCDVATDVVIEHVVIEHVVIEHFGISLKESRFACNNQQTSQKLHPFLLAACSEFTGKTIVVTGTSVV
jgi:hypothetical protein